MRFQSDEEWAYLRVASASAFQAATYASLPGVPEQKAYQFYCYARAQLGYIVGETTGLSYIHGFGAKYITQVHHRDSVCTLEEDDAGECSQCAFR